MRWGVYLCQAPGISAHITAPTLNMSLNFFEDAYRLDDDVEVSSCLVGHLVDDGVMGMGFSTPEQIAAAKAEQGKK